MVDVKARVALSNLMAATIRATSKIMWLMAMASMWARKASVMRGNGKIMCPTEMARLHTQTAQGISGNF